MSDQQTACYRRSDKGIACDRPAQVYIDGQWMCALHGQEAEIKKKSREA